MKTRDRILIASLELLNEEGEANVSALDIANALEISPGNLYYHFKGKDAIIEALFGNFEDEVDLILQGAQGRLQTLEDHWVFLYILLEEIYDFRFFYQSLGILTERYPALGRQFTALTQRIRSTFETSLDPFLIDDPGPQFTSVWSPIMEQFVQILTFWLEEETIYQHQTSAADLIHLTVFKALLVVSPYLQGDDGNAQFEIVSKYQEMVGRGADLL